MDEPAISVIVPIYQVERYVAECVESLRAQTFPRFEAVCVDDGSPDDSVRIAREATAGDERFRFVAQENAGLSAARNHGMREARGTYVLLLDSDDLLAPEALARLHARATADDLDYLDFTARTFYESARVRRVLNEDYYEKRTSIPGVMTGPELFTRYMQLGEYYCPAPFHFFKRDLFERAALQFAEGVIHEDELFSPLLIAHARRAGFLNEPLYLRRMRADSIMTTKRGVRNVEGVLHVTRELESWLRAHAADYDRAFVAAFGQRIAFLRMIAAIDAERAKPAELDAFEAQLEGDALVDFALAVRGGMTTRDFMRGEFDLHRTRAVAHAALAVPRALKDALADRRR